MSKNRDNDNTFAPIFEKIALYLQGIIQRTNIENNSNIHYGLSVSNYTSQGVS